MYEGEMMGSVGYGNNYALSNYVVVGDNEEIPQGAYAYVFNQQQGSQIVPEENG